ncbi:(2Fe-2S) ferredoxin domain-containing protein [Spirulina sp. 06S082]|uniref:(2Fe-2S) ferredoxin domain-containing protein n=1 Tax=Spirulina sp. 06S082 TaxID=3110248 RepID=UPI002B21B82B|nr:(2Fe-2S) ferredoxin domain-containing protein [Spirulina sp. 06S082]MEA5471062.1 (2Fe-2S) ferredoxin domain-containing protein [Spirulina sp. 06S082]
MNSSQQQRTVLVCQNCTCLAQGAKALLEAFQVADLPDDVEIVASDCLGQCNMAPNVRIIPDETWYCRLSPEDVPHIVKQHLHEGKPVAEKLHPRIHSYYSFS